MDLFLVALLLPEPLRSDVWVLKQEVHMRTGSRNAVRLPPHITLIPPFRQPPEFGVAMGELLAHFAHVQAACPVILQDFAWFQDRTLYVEVAENNALQQLHADLHRLCTQNLPTVPEPRRPFVPHVTLATRDLPPHAVPALQLEFAERHYQGQGWLSELVLFRHDGQQWQTQTTVTLPLP